MAYVPSNIRAFASTRETSNEIALAIFEIAEEGEEARMWESPTEAEAAAVMAKAWALTDEDELHWGVETLRR